MLDPGSITKEKVIARLATLASIELIVAGGGDPAEQMAEIRRVFELDAMNTHAEGHDHDASRSDSALSPHVGA